MDTGQAVEKTTTTTTTQKREKDDSAHLSPETATGTATSGFSAGASGTRRLGREGSGPPSPLNISECDMTTSKSEDEGGRRPDSGYFSSALTTPTPTKPVKFFISNSPRNSAVLPEDQDLNLSHAGGGEGDFASTLPPSLSSPSSTTPPINIPVAQSASSATSMSSSHRYPRSDNMFSSQPQSSSPPPSIADCLASSAPRFHSQVSLDSHRASVSVSRERLQERLRHHQVRRRAYSDPSDRLLEEEEEEDVTDGLHEGEDEDAVEDVFVPRSRTYSCPADCHLEQHRSLGRQLRQIGDDFHNVVRTRSYSGGMSFPGRPRAASAAAALPTSHSLPSSSSSPRFMEWFRERLWPSVSASTPPPLPSSTVVLPAAPLPRRPQSFAGFGGITSLGPALREEEPMHEGGDGDGFDEVDS